MTTIPDQPAPHHPIAPSSWIGGDIPRREGKCNVLLIAPHGHPKDDTYTGKLARKLADRLDCYAVINEKYQKPTSAGVANAMPGSFIADLYKKKDAHLPEIKPFFFDRIDQFKKDIINKFGSLFILHVHGIKTENVPKVAKLIPAYKKNPNKLQAVIGYGQWKNNDTKFTADLRNTVLPFIKRLNDNSLETGIAPTEPIKVKGKNAWYCGWSKIRLNQYLYDSEFSMQSIQIEFKGAGIRDNEANRTKAADALAEAIKPFLVSAVQKGSIDQIKAGEIADFAESNFKFRYDEIESDKEKFHSLVESIKTDGVLNNIIVRKSNDGNGKPYQLISGFRRMTALKAALSENSDFANATVPARILESSVSNDEAYRISFTENLARKDLSVWEIAKACSDIEKQLSAAGIGKTEIDEHIAGLLQKHPRTVRRYLKLAAIKNKDVADAVHKGSINYLDALEIGDNDLEEDDITALLGHLKNHPKPTRAFKQFYENLEYCCECSEMPLSAVLECKNADGFLSLENEELFARVEHLRDKTGKRYSEILNGEAGSLIRAIPAIDAETARKSFQDRFAKASRPISNKVSKAFKKSNIDAQLKIKPMRGNQVSLTISAPVDQIHQVINLISSEIGNKLISLEESFESRSTIKKPQNINS